LCPATGGHNITPDVPRPGRAGQRKRELLPRTGGFGIAAEKETHIILESIADGVFTVDDDWKITLFNRAAEDITGIGRDEAVGHFCWEVFRTNVCETDCVLRQTMNTGKPIVNRPVYIVRGDGVRIPVSVSTALLKDDEGRVVGGVETFRDLSLVEELRKELKGTRTLGDIISKSSKMSRLMELVERIAESNATFLIEGASGTGKEMFARVAHRLSPRSRGPFVAVNCGALPDTLLESELFGYKAGAFTDAGRDRPGRFETARGGTLFLDEIGDISPAMQVRLLRVLQERVYEPLGSSESVDADVRFIAATNRNLKTLVKKGVFREDLYYRINVVSMKLPRLAERKEDIPLLADHFIRRFNRLQSRDVVGLRPEALAALVVHDWPGNVRELENAVEHAFILCREDWIELAHLPEQLVPEEQSLPAGGGLSLADIEAHAIRDALERNGFKRMATARELGIDKNTLRRKIRKYRIRVPE
jgi:PAS domain S-box-containing protein